VSADPLAVHGLGADANVYAYVHGTVLKVVDYRGLAEPDMVLAADDKLKFSWAAGQVEAAEREKARGVGVLAGLALLGCSRVPRACAVLVSLASAKNHEEAAQAGAALVVGEGVGKVVVGGGAQLARGVARVVKAEAKAGGAVPGAGAPKVTPPKPEPVAAPTATPRPAVSDAPGPGVTNAPGMGASDGPGPGVTNAPGMGASDGPGPGVTDGPGPGARSGLEPWPSPAAKVGVNLPVSKVVNSNMPHAAERAVGRAGFGSVKEARSALQEFGAGIEKNGLPSGAIRDTAHADRVIVPGFGEGGAVVYQVKDGTLKLKTVLEWKPPQ
jgi:hypothetical protein